MKLANLSTYLLIAIAGGWFATQTSGSTLFTSQAAESAEAEAPVSLSLVRSVELPSAKALEAGATPEKQGMDSYVDWDLGTAAYLHESGSMAAVRMPANWIMKSSLIPEFGMYSITMQRSTGIAYFLDDAQWMPIDESKDETLMIGDYDLTFGVVEETAYAIRFDKYSGRTWLLERDHWTPIEGNLEGWPKGGK